MTCCLGKGVIRVGYHDGSPTLYGLCLCPAGRDLRSNVNATKVSSPLWHVWAALHQVQFEHVALIEELLDDAEVVAMFPDYGKPAEDAPGGLEAAIVAAARPGAAKL